MESEQNCNILTTTLMAIPAFLSRSHGLLNREPGCPASLGHCPHSSIFSPAHLNSNYSIGAPDGPLCWVLVLSTESLLQLIWTPTAQSGVLRVPSAVCWISLQHLISNWLELPVHRVILLFYAHSIQPVDSQGYPLDIFHRMHLLFTQVHVLFWQLGRGQYATPILK